MDARTRYSGKSGVFQLADPDFFPKLVAFIAESIPSFTFNANYTFKAKKQ
jgi:hypothetical protein